MSIEENVEKVLEEIAAAARAAGREPGEVTLCAATKMNDAQAVRRAIQAGVDCCGETGCRSLRPSWQTMPMQGLRSISSAICRPIR